MSSMARTPLPPLPKQSPWLQAGKVITVATLTTQLVACEVDQEMMNNDLSFGTDQGADQSVAGEQIAPMPPPPAGEEVMAGEALPPMPPPPPPMPPPNPTP